MLKNYTSISKDKKIITIKLNADFFYERALKYYEKKELEKALKYFQKATEYANDPMLFCNIAVLLADMGRINESNQILQFVLNTLDPNIYDCYYYLAHNYLELGDYEATERYALLYLHHALDGDYREEVEEILEYISTFLSRPLQKYDEKWLELSNQHFLARKNLEEQRFVEAKKILESLVRDRPEFLSAKNNLALTYYYLGEEEKAIQAAKEVLNIEPGNIHALANLALFYFYLKKEKEFGTIMNILKKLIPTQFEQTHKLATTLGMFGEHALALKHYNWLIKYYEVQEAVIFHHAAVAAWNSGKYTLAKKRWLQLYNYESNSQVASFYLYLFEQLTNQKINGITLNYQYSLPFVDQIFWQRLNYDDFFAQKNNILLMQTFIPWGMEFGTDEVKTAIIHLVYLIGKSPQWLINSLQPFFLKPEENLQLKMFISFVLWLNGYNNSILINHKGKTSYYNLGVFDTIGKIPDSWKEVLETVLGNFKGNYSLILLYDVYLVWYKFLEKAEDNLPKVRKTNGWAGAIEYMVLKMYNIEVTLKGVSERYEVSVATLKRNIDLIESYLNLNKKITNVKQLREFLKTSNFDKQ